jgi:dihydroorotase/N-acyl-D-amino-acid deacylase
MGRARSAVVLGWLLSTSLAMADAQPPALASPVYDIVIRNGRVIDGTGSPWYAGEVAIRNARIAAITPPGGLKHAQAKRVIDAGGRIVAPGFIDMLGQSERAVLGDPHLESKIFQGITSEITGEGNSIAPRNDAMIAEDQAAVGPGVALPEFRTVAEYLRRVDAQHAAINLGTYVGATTVRRMVLGDADRAPTAAELDQMQELVRQAMRDGAFGVSSSLMYAPGVFAKTSELVALAKAAAETGGIYATHMRSEADGLMASLYETFTIAREARIPVEIFRQPRLGAVAALGTRRRHSGHGRPSPRPRRPGEDPRRHRARPHLGQRVVHGQRPGRHRALSHLVRVAQAAGRPDAGSDRRRTPSGRRRRSNRPARP